MILWLLTVTAISIVMIVLSINLHASYHVGSRGERQTCYGPLGRCEYYNSFYSWAVRAIIALSIVSPMFLEYTASVFSDNVKNYIVVNGEYKAINSVVWDLPWGPRIVTVSTVNNEYRDSRIISMKGDRIYTLVPVFTWKYSSDPSVYDKTEKLGWSDAEKLFMKFILQNESEIRSLVSTIDIKSQQGKKQFENKLRELITSKIQIPGIEFGLEYCAIYEK